MEERTQSIGVFDSGLGGLTVLRAVMDRLPQYRYVYLGDTARAPYGDRSPDEVLRFAREAVDFLFAQKCELILFACNTVSAEALRAIQQTYLKEAYGERKRVLGVIVPTLEYVAADSGHRKVGLLATRGTVQSGTYPAELSKIAPQIEIVEMPAPLLVPLVEAGEHMSPKADTLVEEYVAPLRAAGVDTLVLGCTHYEHLLPQIERAAGPGIKVVSQSGVVAEKLAEYLARHPEIEGTLSREGSVDFYTTDETGRFKEQSELFFGKPIHARRAKL